MMRSRRVVDVVVIRKENQGAIEAMIFLKRHEPRMSKFTSKGYTFELKSNLSRKTSRFHRPVQQPCTGRIWNLDHENGLRGTRLRSIDYAQCDCAKFCWACYALLLWSLKHRLFLLTISLVTKKINAWAYAESTSFSVPTAFNIH